MSSTTSPPTARLPGAGAPTVRAVRIDVVAGPDAGKEVRLEQPRLVLGSHRTADLVLGDALVSRFHCELAIDGDAVHLRDLGSRNGTWIDTVEIAVARLRGPTIITLGRTELRIELLADETPLDLAAGEHFGRLAGVSPAMRAAFARLERAAAGDHHLVIEGERGTGKDLAAVAVHEHSARRDGPLEVVDCGGPALDVETELFGRRERAGALERCSGGTLVLDDVGALGGVAQRMLVRALEQQAVRRAGGELFAFDTRVVALARSDLRSEVNRDQFRAELLDVLAVGLVRLPPLRERPEDVPLLIAAFLDDAGARDTRTAAHLGAPETLERLRAAAWPGNVRELRAYVERLAAAGASSDPSADPATDVPATLPLIDSSLPLRDARRRWIAYFERAYLLDLLVRSNGNVSLAATRAGVDRVHLHRMVTQAGLRAELDRRRTS